MVKTVELLKKNVYICTRSNKKNYNYNDTVD